MKKILISLALLLVSGVAHAQTVENDLAGLGVPPEVASYLADILPAGSVVGNDTYIKGRNQANSADISIVKVDSSDNTVLNCSASDDLILQLEDDASRRITFDAGSDAAIAMTFGDAGTTATQMLTISASTSDADDDSSLRLAGGGAFGTDGTRGATIVLPGEEVAGGSDITYNAGAGDTHIFAVAGTTEATISGSALTIPSGNVLQLDVGTVAALGADNTDAAPVVDQLTYVTASDGTKGVILPASTGSGTLYIIHNTVNGQDLKVYPDASGAINGGTATTGNVLVAGEETGFFIDVATNTYHGGVAVDF